MSIEERLAKIRAVRKKREKNENIEESEKEINAVSLLPLGRDSAVKNLKFGMALYVYGGYYEVDMGSIFCPLFNRASVRKCGLDTYCIEPYPDICVCGQIFYGSCNSLRMHCIVCQGKNGNTIKGAYHFYRYKGLIRCLEINFDIHLSWAEYAIAWALAKFQPPVIGSLERTLERTLKREQEKIQKREQERSHG